MGCKLCGGDESQHCDSCKKELENWSDSLIRIQCMRCRTDIIFITDDGEIKEEEGSIWVGDFREINIYCNKCTDGVECVIY